jgi:autotransporter-associated beta strand protein
MKATTTRKRFVKRTIQSFKESYRRFNSGAETFFKSVSLIIAALMSVYSPVVLAATPIRWTGLGTDTTSWTDADNWFGGVVPTILESAAFRPISGTISIDLGSLNQSLGGFNIQDATTALSGPSFIAINSSQGKKLTLSGDIGFLNATKAVSRTLTLNLPVDIYNSANWDIISLADAVVVAGSLSTAAGQNSTITKAGQGTLTLSGNNTAHSGGFTFQAGSLNLNHANALGTGTFVINGSGLKLDNSSGGAITINGVSAITLGSDFTFTGSNDLNFSSANINLGTNAGGARTITVQGSNLSFGGVISNGTHGTTPTIGLIKTGAGRLTLSGANTFTGAVTVSEGVLLISNDAALGTSAAGTSLAAGTTLEISGGITVADAISTAGGILSNVAGANSLTGAITTSANTEIQTAVGTTLTISSK